MNPYAARLLKLTKFYFWALLVISNVTVSAIALLFWLWPETPVARVLAAYLSTPPTRVGFR